jgi:WD40 repeat protein
MAGAVALAALAVAGLLGRKAGADFIVWQAPGNFTALDFSPDGELLAAAGDKVKLWRVASGVPYRDFGWGEDAVALAFMPSGAALAVSSRDEKTGRNVKLWRMPDSGLVAVLPDSAGNRPLAFSPDGSLLAIGTDYMSSASPLGVQLWAMPSRKVVGALASPEPVAAGYVTAIAFSPEGKLVASADDSGTIWISSVADRKRLNTIQTGNMVTVALAFSPSGKALAYGGSSGPDVTVVGVPEGKRIGEMKGESRARGRLGLAPAIKALAFSPDGRLLASCESTGDLARVELFRVSDGELLKTLDASGLVDRADSGGDSSIDLRDVQFSPDGQYLAWCGSQGVVVARVAEMVG